MADEIKRCPTCGRVERGETRPVRICHNCLQPIKKNHKYVIEMGPRGSWIVHRNCEDPTSYRESDNA